MKKAAHRHFPKHWKLKSRPTPAPISAESATQETVVLERCCESPGLACRSTIASEGTVRCHTMRRGAMRIVEDVTGLPDLPIVLIIQSRQIRRLCCCSRSQSASEQAEQVGRANLAQWLGVSAADVRIEAGPLMQAPAQSTPTTPNAATHPLAVSQMANVDSVHASQQLLDRSYFPRFNFQSAFAARGTGARVIGTHLGGLEGLAMTTTNWAIGMTATFPMFDFFSLRERKRIEEQNERAERAIYDKVVQDLNFQSEQARAETLGARRVAENTPIQLDSVRVLEEQTRVRYQAGLATIFEVADSQRMLLQAEVGNVIARIGVWRALLAEAAAKGDLADLLK